MTPVIRFALAALTLTGAAPAGAQTWPNGNITLVVPFTPGGSTDILARLLSQKLGDALGVGVIVDSRPGAAGSTASAQVARARPDGQTIAMGHIGTLAVNPSLYPNLGYDPLTSFAHISTLARVHNVLAVNPKLPVNSVLELIDYAKRHPGELNYGSGGNGSAAHIATAAFMVATGIQLVHVPYRGTAPAMTDLIGGQIQMMMTGAPAVLPQSRAGLLRALGVSGATRIPAAPDIPTISEAGVPGFEASQWYGIVAPAGTPRPIIDRLNQETRKALASPDIVEALTRDGAEPWATSPEEFRAFIAREIPRWAIVVEKAGIKP